MDSKDNNDEIKNDGVNSNSFTDKDSVNVGAEEHTHKTAEQPYTEKKKNGFGKRIVNFLMNNKLAVLLFIILIVVFAWLSIKNSQQERQFLQEKTELQTNYETKIDSLKVDYITFASEVFSWSVRSEMLRNNEENLNQLVSAFVKKSNVSLVQIVDMKDKKVILSSDKKYEGEAYTGNLDQSDSETVVQTNQEGKQQIITPIMGFNSKIGILVVTM